MKRILILQSYEDYRSNLTEFFEFQGYLVFSDLNCKSGLELIRNDVFDIIICDLDDEFKSDFRDLKKFVNEDKVRNTPIFFISTKFKDKSEVIPLNINHQSFYIVNGKTMSHITQLIETVLPPKSDS
jgi:DNA-binding response OmpR family regulator